MIGNGKKTGRNPRASNSCCVLNNVAGIRVDVCVKLVSNSFEDGAGGVVDSVPD